MQTTEWSSGLLRKRHIPCNMSILSSVRSSQISDKAHRLYITDIAIPNHDDMHVPTDAPGVLALLIGLLCPVRSFELGTV